MNPEDIRRFYAEEIRVVANLRSPELVNAFALDSIAKEFGGYADEFGAIGNA